MSIREVQLPSLGDDDDAVVGGEVSALLCEVGADIAAGGDLLKLTTDKAAFVVPAPCAGRVVEWRVGDGDAVAVGQTICIMETPDGA